MIVIEMKLAGELEGTQMISMQHISEIEEMGENVRLFMASGNSYVITGESFASGVNTVEGFHYLKMKTEEQLAAEAAEAEKAAEAIATEVKEVEGELVTECCPA